MNLKSKLYDVISNANLNFMLGLILYLLVILIKSFNTPGIILILTSMYTLFNFKMEMPKKGWSYINLFI